MKTLYIDCFSGISGDMFIGALLDAGGDSEHLVKELKKLKISEEYELKWKKIVKNGITSTKFDVEVKNAHKHTHHHEHSHDHDDHDNGHSHHHEHGHTHDHEHGHTHGHHHSHGEHGHTHDHTHHHSHGEHVHTHDHNLQHSHGEHEHTHGNNHQHEHRTYQSIKEMIETAGFKEEVKDLSLRIFKKIAEAEGHIHGLPIEKVHFHEVGAVDSIIDIIGTAILLDQLRISRVKSSAIVAGSGKIRIDHGIYPVPAPATLEMLKGIPIQQTDIKAELTTPTGAAIVAVLAEEFCPFPSINIESIGYGAGTKTFPDRPNVLRVVIGE